MSVNKNSKISVVVFTKNEEKNIEGCLKSVVDFADEINLIDMQSQDQTVKIAETFKAKIYSVKDHRWVEPVRNYGINKCNYDWILVLDADERIPKTLAKRLVQIVKEDKVDAVKIPTKVIFFKKWIRHTAWWPDYHVRFFRKGHVQWVVKIHPDIKVKGRILELEAKSEYALIHENARDIKTWFEKMNHHTDYEDFFDNLPKVTAEDILSRFRREFFWRYFENKGYLDGMHGYVMSKFMEFYRFLEFVKYWERKGYPDLVSGKVLRQALEKEWGFTKSAVDELQKNNSQLQAQLDSILNSKTFQLWQGYCKLRDKIIRLFK